MKKFKILKLKVKVSRLEYRLQKAETLVSSILHDVSDKAHPNVAIHVKAYTDLFRHNLITEC